MFLLDPSSKEPIFIQIQNQILKFIDAGVLNPGDRLPSVRQLAQDNGINPNTVARAYNQLEQRGYLYNVPKKGVYVKNIKKDEITLNRIDHFIQKIHDDGITRKDLYQIIERVYGKEENDAED